MKTKHHKNLNLEKWSKMSLGEMMGNIGSEISRAIHWQKKGDEEAYKNSLERALELTDLTLESVEGFGRKKEVARFREILGDFYSSGSSVYSSGLEDLDKYTLQFALRERVQAGA